MQLRRARLSVPLQLAWWLLAAVAMLAGSSGCYHYTFQHRPTTVRADEALVTYQERKATFFNGFVGNGTIHTVKYCARPVRTELRVRPSDVILSVATLLIYTPHTLYVTCEVPQRRRFVSR